MARGAARLSGLQQNEGEKPGLTNGLIQMVGEAGLEPTTPGLEGRCSIQLSYSPGFLPLYRHPEQSTRGGESGEGRPACFTGNESWVPHLPRFPAEACGVDTLHAPFLNERRTRGPL